MELEFGSIILFQRDEDPELEKAVILKAEGDNLLAAGIDGRRGFWLQLKTSDVERVLSPGVDVDRELLIEKLDEMTFSIAVMRREVKP